MRHVLSVKDFSSDWVREVLGGAETMMSLLGGAARSRGFVQPFAKCTLAFFEPSTRTSGSFGEAARLLDFACHSISGAEATSLAKDESIANTVRMLGKGNQGADILVMRTKLEGAPRFAAEILAEMDYATAVLSGGDGTNEHPTQALLDWVTIKRSLGRTGDLVLGVVGDLEMSRVAHSDLGLARLMGVRQVRLSSAPEVRVQPKYKRGFEEIKEGDSLDLLADCDVVIVLRVQSERYTDKLKLARAKSFFRVTRKVLDSWKKNVIVLHPLPCVDEIDPAIYYDPRILMYRQAELAIPTRMYLCVQSYKSRRENHSPPPYRLACLQIIREASVDQHLAARRREYQYFRPIRDGVILDHIPAGRGIAIRRLLRGVEDSAIIHLIEGVPSQRFGRKDVLVLEHYSPSEHFLGAVAFLWPEASFNILRDGMHRKARIDLSQATVGIMPCPNPYCITNHDPEAKTRTRFSIVRDEKEEFLAECGYCEREFTRDEIRAVFS